mgnify:CR=1 FL=1|jgi:hypothetical protein
MGTRAALEVASQESESDDQYVATHRQLITNMVEDPRSISSSLD